MAGETLTKRKRTKSLAVTCTRILTGLGRARVSFPVDVDQLRGVHMGVTLGRAEPRVPEQLLDGAEIGAALQEMRRKRVTQRVRTNPHARAALRDVAA